MEIIHAAAVLLYVLSSLYQPDAAHDVVAIFDSEDLSDLFRYGDSSTRDDFSEEWNVFLVNLYRQELTSGRNAENPVI